MTLTLESINAMSDEVFVATLGGVVEHSPWVAEQIVGRRPFESVLALHGAMMERVSAASREAQVRLACAHPELAGREATAGTLTADSNSEQARLGLLTLSQQDHARLTSLNQSYRHRFGIPFITAVRLHRDLASVFDSLERRLENEPDAELREAMAQIAEIVSGRLAKLFDTALG
ncbi:2-oxo-4-hydroxy-4-carboxy-5-ureidoimidazoline decarboxylase [soil metagenome]